MIKPIAPESVSLQWTNAPKENWLLGMSPPSPPAEGRIAAVRAVQEVNELLEAASFRDPDWTARVFAAMADMEAENVEGELAQARRYVEDLEAKLGALRGTAGEATTGPTP